MTAAQTQRCEATEPIRAERCDLVKGHPGAHIHSDRGNVTAWGFRSDEMTAAKERSGSAG